jgi:hypothetical protein
MKNPEVLLETVGRIADGTASAEEVREVNAALRSDAELRRAYLRYMNLESALASAAAARPVVVRKPSPLPWVRWAAVASLAAAVVVCVLLRMERPPEVVAPFATLVAAHDAVWGDPNVELALNGGQLPSVSIRLESGTAEFLLNDGATVVLRGPAAVRFPQPKRVHVEGGRVVCRCPSPESRITVETASTEVVDLGTEFFVEARADRSALVAVLSGEVRVGAEQHLRKGEAAEVRADGILIVRPLTQEEVSNQFRAVTPAEEVTNRGSNLLKDAGFDRGLSAETWGGTEPNLTPLADGGRHGRAIRVSASGFAHFPQCRQRVETGDVSGKVVMASVWAANPASDRLRPGQFAMLKIAFVNERGREFGFAKRQFLNAQSPPGQFEEIRLAAIAPPGTHAIQFQLVLSTNARKEGSVLFDDAEFVVADAPPQK